MSFDLGMCTVVHVNFPTLADFCMWRLSALHAFHFETIALRELN